MEKNDCRFKCLVFFCLMEQCLLAYTLSIQQCEDGITVNWDAGCDCDDGINWNEYLDDLFRSYGAVQSVYVPENGKFGWANVKMKDASGTNKAMKFVQGYCANILYVNCPSMLNSGRCLGKVIVNWEFEDGFELAKQRLKTKLQNKFGPVESIESVDDGDPGFLVKMKNQWDTDKVYNYHDLCDLKFSVNCAKSALEESVGHAAGMLVSQELNKN